MFLYSKIRVGFIENQRAVQKTNNQFRLNPKFEERQGIFKTHSKMTFF